MAKWIPPYGFTCTVHHMDAKVGGTYKMSFKNFTTGHAHSFGGTYRELVPFEKIRYTDQFDDPNLPGEMQATITLKPVIGGTELTIVQEGLPEVIALEMCYLAGRSHSPNWQIWWSRIFRSDGTSRGTLPFRAAR